MNIETNLNNLPPGNYQGHEAILILLNKILNELKQSKSKQEDK